MKTLIVMAALLVASASFAGEPKVIETETGYVVEYTGAPAVSTSIEKATPLERMTYLSKEIERLEREGMSAMKLTGKETAAELQAKRAAGAEKAVQMQKYLDEMRAIKDANSSEVQKLKDYFAESNRRFEAEHRPASMR